MKKERIRRLKEEGKTQSEISKELNIPYSTVQYYYNEKIRQRALNYQKEYQKRNPQTRGDKYREYQRKYHKKYYQKNLKSQRNYHKLKSKEYYYKEKDIKALNS